MDEKLSRVDPKLLELLVCPLSRGGFHMIASTMNLFRKRLSLPIRSAMAFQSCWCPRPVGSTS